MNMNQIVNMIMRTIMRRVINSGVNAGFDAVSNISQKKRRRDLDDDPYDDVQAYKQGQSHQVSQTPDKPKMTPEERQRLREMRQARRAARDQSQNR